MSGDILANLPTDAISLIALIAVITGQVYQRRRDSDLRTQVGNVEHHVANTHETNLRDDIDELKVGMVEATRAIGRIGSEMRADRTANEEFRRETYERLLRQDRIVEKHHPGEP